MASKNGFIFSLDALLAVVVLVAALGGLYFLLGQSSSDSAMQLISKKQADDALAVLDKGGDLSQMNQTALNSTLNLLLSSSIKYNFSSEYYTYSPAGSFSLNTTLLAGQAYSGKSSQVTGERLFIVLQNGSPAYYGRARLMLWK